MKSFKEFLQEAKGKKEVTQVRANRTYSVYMFNPNDNSYAYLLGYFEAKSGEDLEAFKKRVAKSQSVPGHKHLHVFE